MSREGTGEDIRFPSPAVGNPNNQYFIITIIKQLERGGVYLFSIINYICRGVAILYIIERGGVYLFSIINYICRGVAILYIIERGGVSLFSITNYICRGVAILYILYKRRSYPFIFVRGVDILYLMCKITKGVDILLFS